MFNELKVTRINHEKLQITRHIVDARFLGKDINLSEIINYGVQISCRETDKNLIISYEEMAIMAIELGLLNKE